MLGWAFRNEAVFDPFPLLEVTCAHTPLNNPSKTVWFTKMDSGDILALICCELPIWGE